MRGELRGEIEALVAQGLTPGLDVVLVGEDPPSQIYVRNKQRSCERLGIRSRVHRLETTTPQSELEQLIRDLNQDDEVDGILVQLPLPKGLDAKPVLELIDPAKDVDGLHLINQGRLLAGEEGLQPCTPLGSMALIDSIGYDISGKKAVVVGRSNLVGKPVAQLLLQRNATVTMCHSRTQDLAAEVGQADIVIAAVGYPELVKGSWIKEGAVVVDVGINRRDDGSLVGDVEFEESQKRALAITPVPGGVGPMTITMLLYNTVDAAKRRRGAHLNV
ncbi:MAG: bifunctional methylenetetrahydrofolate dehydrogenase/methenyltetrahydrofolate cyclohydrolase FolD [Deltaproteobacteria bacterium]|nr:MAG: bifunctional methylenetetrahydrofolate dehydrogenase/methenyltetrahydrofolate cyclohydrolase FolD [Deltaproteobacteria bacterium]